MRAKRVSLSTEALLDPQAGIWPSTEATQIALIGAPVAMQPTEAVRNTWEGKSTGTVERLSARAVHNGQVLAMRLEWENPTENNQLSDSTSFIDAAAIAFALGAGAATAITMGSPEHPVNLWYWRADENRRGLHLRARGIGTSETLDTESVRGNGLWRQGRWHVVIARALLPGAQRHAVRLTAGGKTEVGFAVWNGANRERGGIKAFSTDWTALHLER